MPLWFSLQTRVQISPPPQNKKLLNKPPTNQEIKASRVRLIDENGKQIGVVSLEEALSLAREKNLDLVQVTEKVDPPVCKIVDASKYLYAKEKKERKGKKKAGETKQVRFSLNISRHDLETKIDQVEKFIEEGKKVKLELVLKGREKTFEGLAKEKINYFIQILQEKVPVKIERELKKEGIGFTLILVKK